MELCIIIPVYNHEHSIIQIISKLKQYKIPCILVNDGSSKSCSDILEKCAEQESNWVMLLNRSKNGGKGAAVIDGFELAYDFGYTHAIQIDADGQHNINDIPLFIKASELNSEAMILGQPVFDESVPKIRLYGRRIANLWVIINTLSYAIADGMCGFRLYPLAAVNKLIRTTPICQGMDFDMDIVVRLYWQGVDVINIPTAVHYPIDGVSHFRYIQDNIKIIRSHVILLFGMLIRIPQLWNR